MRLPPNILLLSTILIMIPFLRVEASHIRAGEITFEQMGAPSLRTYAITITGYLDNASPVRNDFGIGILDFGDGSEPVIPIDNPFRFTDTNASPEIGVISITVIHTFPGDATFSVSYQEANRSEGVLNLPNSVSFPFFVESQITVNTILINECPFFSFLPADMGAVGSIFEHNPGAIDFDGDSLAYRISEIRSTDGVIASGFNLPNEQDIADLGDLARNAAGTGPPTLSISNDPDDLGTLIWDAPNQQGTYGLAIVLEEWRRINGELLLLSSITRDMQIIVCVSNNESPSLSVPANLNIIAGRSFEENISGNDPNNQDLSLNANGVPFLLPVNAAATINQASQSPPVNIQFEWTPPAEQVRSIPYPVYIRLTDIPPGENGPPLVDYEVWNITVVGPPPTGLTANQNIDEQLVNLSWDDYEFPEDAVSIQVWRRVNSFNFNQNNNPAGVPDGSYELMAEQDILNTNLQDTVEIENGITFCYRLVAIYPDGSSSIASSETCIIPEINDDVIPTVTISSTVSSPTNLTQIPINISFSEEVNGFDSTDVVLSNASVQSFSSDGNVVFSFNAIPNASGIVRIEVPANVATDPGGNGNIAAIPFEIEADNIILGIDEDLAEIGLDIFPNPVQGELIISGNRVRQIQLTLVNILGQEVSVPVSRNGDRTVLSFSNLKSGIYLLHITHNNKELTKRLIKP